MHPAEKTVRGHNRRRHVSVRPHWPLPLRARRAAAACVITVDRHGAPVQRLWALRVRHATAACRASPCALPQQHAPAPTTRLLARVLQRAALLCPVRDCSAKLVEFAPRQQSVSLRA